MWFTLVNTLLSVVQSIESIEYRRSVLVKGIDVRLKEFIQDVAVKCNAEMLELEIMPDHVHLFVEVEPQFGIHTRTKRWIKSRLPTLWTNSYSVSTIGGAPL